MKLKSYEIIYALSGGFGGIERAEWVKIEATSLQDAMEYAYEEACNEYASYEGYHGLRDESEIAEEFEEADEEFTNEDVWQIYVDEREGWLEYDAREVE